MVVVLWLVSESLVKDGKRCDEFLEESRFRAVTGSQVGSSEMSILETSLLIERNG